MSTCAPPVRVASEYARRIFDELKDKRLDRQILDRFAARLRDAGPACDMGCGPGQVARYLHERGVRVCGIDLSPVTLEHALLAADALTCRPSQWEGTEGTARCRRCP